MTEPAAFPSSEWLDSTAVAGMLGIARSTVWRYRNSGRLPSDADVAGRPLWHVTTVERYRDQLAPRARVARVKRAEREAARVHGSPTNGTTAVCGECGQTIVFRVHDRPMATGTAHVGRWEDEEAPRAHQHGAPPNGP